MKKWDYEGDFLEQFDPRRRSTIANMFCHAVRDGEMSVENVLTWVWRDCKRRLLNDPDNDVRFALETLSVLLRDGKGIDFAEHILWRENLPFEVKTQLKKQAQTTNVQSFMDSQPPSEKQVAYLKSLGCAVQPTSKLDASNLIAMHLRKGSSVS